MACSAHFPQHHQHSQHPQHPQHSHHPQHFQHPQKEYHVYHDHSPAAYCAEEEEELVDARLSAYVCGMEEMERVQEMIRRLQNKYHEFSSVIALKSDEVQKLNSDIMKRNDELHAISQNVRYFQNEKTQQEHQLREVSLAVSTKQRELERLSKAISNERLEHANDVAQEKLIITGIVRQRKEEETAVERLRQQRLEEELKLRLCMDKQTLHTTEQSHLHWEAQDKQKQAELEREKIAALDAVLERQQVEMSEKLCAVADDRLYELDTLRMMQKTALSSSQTCVTAPCRQATGGSVGGAELDATPRAESLFVSFAKPSSRRHEVLKSLNEQMSKLRRADEGKSGDVRLSLETATVLFDSIISANTQIDALKARSGQTFLPADDESATKDLRMQSFRSQFQQEKDISRAKLSTTRRSWPSVEA
eukprot:GEMP01016693.1.p1 GENE.GEMP01016693.1~~GEMP01016693.1.p1  ORF type:complete len:421 (+),score=123.45 GEMP01016693.1:506-1768(+)